MMQEIVLYDPERKPANWTDLMRPGQYAVFHCDVGTDVERTRAGRYLGGSDRSTCILFDSLAEAEGYCAAKVEQVRSLRCDIYDHTGKSKPPLMTYVNRAELGQPRKHAIWGWLLIAASLPCFWIDGHSHPPLILPSVVGINMIFAGFRLIYWGLGGGSKLRATRMPAK